MKPLRTYLDHAASAPVLAAAREAMIAAMDVTGNPSSVHTEGRAAKALLERARAQVAEAFGASGADIVFTSSATEAAALALRDREMSCAPVEHDAVSSWCAADLPVDEVGRITIETPKRAAVQLANSETGVIQSVPQGLAVVDATQAFGKIPTAFSWLGCDMALISSHKIGGPKGVGALVIKQGLDVDAQIKGGGQEMGRRSGTENILGAVGFGAAAEAATKALNDGIWDAVAHRRDYLETCLREGVKDADGVRFVGAEAQDAGMTRLPNVANVVTAGWKGETQVMQMDLAGFSVSAGSACSSGKVKTSKVLEAMGFSGEEAASAMRVSLGIDAQGHATTKHEIERFAEKWLAAYARWLARSQE